MSHLERLLARTGEQRRTFAVLMLDVDHFKRVNDTHGHAAGDIVLKEFAHRISHNLRNFDLAARIGGEEFLVVLPDVDLPAAGCVARRLCGVISDEPIVFSGDGSVIGVTTSIGVTLAGLDEESVDTVLRRADTALYRAKRGGRNRYEIDVLDGEASAEKDDQTPTLAAS